MKKNIIYIVCAIVAILLIVGVVMVLKRNMSSGTTQGQVTSSKNISGSLDDIMSKVYTGSNGEYAKLATIPITKENLSQFLGIESLDFKEGLASEPMMSSVAHSVVLVRVNNSVNIEATKKAIKEKVNPRKWICVGVEPENVIVDSKGDIIILIMDNEFSKQLKQSFQNLK